MAEEQEIQKLRDMARNEQDEAIKEELILTLASYGFKARQSLFDLLDQETDGQRKNFILANIREINKRIGLG